MPRRGVDLQGGQAAALGAHDAGVRCLKYDARHNVVFSGSWDRTVGGWDPRASNGRVATAEVPGKVFALDLAFGAADTKLVVGTSDRHVLFDARNLSTPLQHRESSLKHQTRCLKCFPDATGYALSSIEGRVSVEYFADGDQARKYAFKCHRVGKVVYPVNAIAFHPLLGTFATGGSDGGVSLWDGAHKKRLAQLQPFPTSVAALAFNTDGSKLAIASSSCFEEGEKDHPKDGLYVHTVLNHEVTPKASRAVAHSAKRPDRPQRLREDPQYLDERGAEIRNLSRARDRTVAQPNRDLPSPRQSGKAAPLRESRVAEPVAAHHANPRPAAVPDSLAPSGRSFIRRARARASWPAARLRAARRMSRSACARAPVTSQLTKAQFSNRFPQIEERARATPVDGRAVLFGARNARRNNGQGSRAEGTGVNSQPRPAHGHCRSTARIARPRRGPAPTAPASFRTRPARTAARRRRRPSCLAMARLATHLDCPRSNSRGSSAGTTARCPRAYGRGHRRR